jgi:protein tyrosine/serine phosphatase
MAKEDIVRHLLLGLSRKIIKDVMLLNNNTPEKVLENVRNTHNTKLLSHVTYRDLDSKLQYHYSH